MRTAMGCYMLSGEHTFSEEQEEMYVECSSGINGRPRHGGTRWHESDDAASSTPRGGGVAARNSE